MKDECEDFSCVFTRHILSEVNEYYLIFRAQNIDQKAQGRFKFWLKSIQILPIIHSTEKGFRSSVKETRGFFRCKFNDCVLQARYDVSALEK